MWYLVDVAKTVPITIGDYEFCKIDPATWKRKNTGWHNIVYKDWKIVENDIKICKWLSKTELLDTVKHELWHQVYTTKVTPIQKETWTKMHNESTAPWDFKQVYSKQNELEDFADTFSSSFSKKELPRTQKFKDKISFIKDMIKNTDITKK